MSTLSQITDISAQSGRGGFPWWGILLIIIGCILVAVAGVVGYHFFTKRKLKESAERNVQKYNMNQTEHELEQLKKQYTEVGDD
jgi:uncharacterized protein YpmB